MNQQRHLPRLLLAPTQKKTRRRVRGKNQRSGLVCFLIMKISLEVVKVQQQQTRGDIHSATSSIPPSMQHTSPPQHHSSNHLPTKHDLPEESPPSKPSSSTQPPLHSSAQPVTRLVYQPAHLQAQNAQIPKRGRRQRGSSHLRHPGPGIRVSLCSALSRLPSSAAPPQL